MIRRLFGFLMLLVGLSGIALSLMGIRLSGQLLDQVGAGLIDQLTLASGGLDTVNDTLLLTKETTLKATDSLDTISQAAYDVALTLDSSGPLLDEVRQVATTDVPATLETVQATIPNVAQVATTIDNTLTTLNNFRIDQRILGIRLYYDLGIDYNPNQRFDQSIEEVGKSLEGLPKRLRDLDPAIETTAQNLETLGKDISQIARDLDQVNSSINEMPALLDEYIRLITTINGTLRQTRDQIEGQLAQAKQIITIAFIWLGLMQLAPLYLGWELLRGRQLLRPLAYPPIASPDPTDDTNAS